MKHFIALTKLDLARIYRTTAPLSWAFIGLFLIAVTYGALDFSLGFTTADFNDQITEEELFTAGADTFYGLSFFIVMLFVLIFCSLGLRSFQDETNNHQALFFSIQPTANITRILSKFSSILLILISVSFLFKLVATFLLIVVFHQPFHLFDITHITKTIHSFALFLLIILPVLSLFIMISTLAYAKLLAYIISILIFANIMRIFYDNHIFQVFYNITSIIIDCFHYSTSFLTEFSFAGFDVININSKGPFSAGFDVSITGKIELATKIHDYFLTLHPTLNDWLKFFTLFLVSFILTYAIKVYKSSRH